MEYLSKSYRLDEEVIAWLETLRAAHGSVNKGLRKLAFGQVSVINPTAKREPLPMYELPPAVLATGQRRSLREKGDGKR